MILICCRCQRGIRPGELYDRHDHDRPTSAPLINYSHRGGCPDPSPTPMAGTH